jgi:GNAT superfamily N-acetyltransferase
MVALYNGELAGHVELQDTSGLNAQVVESLNLHAPAASLAALVSLFVDPKLQGKGIGARLMDEAVAWSRRNNKRLVLIVLEKDTAAIRMYEKRGWVRATEYFYETIRGQRYQAFSYLAPE